MLPITRRRDGWERGPLSLPFPNRAQVESRSWRHVVVAFVKCDVTVVVVLGCGTGGGRNGDVSVPAEEPVKSYGTSKGVLR